MKKEDISGIIVYLLIMALAILFGIYVLTGNNTEQLAKEIQKIITNNWKQKGMSVTVLEDMVLTKKQGNEYSGMMKIRYEGKTIQIR